MQGGYLTLGRFRGTPVRVHWSALVGFFLLSGFSFAPGAWIGFLALLLVHEIGHAVLAGSFGLMVLQIDVHALGGSCSMAGNPTARQSSIVAWGGVIGQAILLAAALVISPFLPSFSVFNDLSHVLIWTNLYMIGLNLLPIPPLDGAEAWQIFRRPA